MTYWPSDASDTLASSALYLSEPAFVVTVDSPAVASTVTSVAFNVTWSYTGTTQQSFRVRILASDQVTVVHDSGFVVSSTKSYAVPDVLENSVTYHILVAVFLTTGDFGQSVLPHSFTTAFETVNDVTGLTATAVNTALPRVELEWATFVEDAAETFSQYNVYRRPQPGYSGAVTSLLPVAYLRLNEVSGVTVFDTTSNNNDGTIADGVVLDEPSLVTDDPTDRSALFDATGGSIITIPDATSIQNIWDGGGAVSFMFNIDSDGEGSLGTFVSKGTVWFIRARDESGGFVRIEFGVLFSGTNGIWQTAVNIPISTDHEIAIAYDSDAVGNNPTFVLDGVELTIGSGLTETTGPPTGTRTTDVGSDVFLGNDTGPLREMDGRLDEVALFDATLTTAELQYIQARSGVVPLESWTRIAILSNDIEFLKHRDYCAASTTVWEYAVTATATTVTSTLESAKQSPPVSTSMTFTSLFIHDVADPTQFVEIVHQDVNVSEEVVMRALQVWSRQAPVYHIGEAQHATITVTATDAFHDNRAMWDDLIKLLTRQRTNASIFCVRHRGERYFCQAPTAGRADTRPTLFREAVELPEAHFTEAV